MISSARKKILFGFVASKIQFDECIRRDGGNLNFIKHPAYVIKNLQKILSINMLYKILSLLEVISEQCQYF